MYIMYSAKLFHLLKYAFFLSIFKLDCRKIKSFDKVSFEFDPYLSYSWSFICSKEIGVYDDVDILCSYCNFEFNYWRYSCLEIIPRNMYKRNLGLIDLNDV